MMFSKLFAAIFGDATHEPYSSASTTSYSTVQHCPDINPTTGLPMIDDTKTFDVGGHTWGENVHGSSFDSTSSFTDHYSHNDPWS